jgi:hypothetical protein
MILIIECTQEELVEKYKGKDQRLCLGEVKRKVV